MHLFCFMTQSIFYDTIKMICDCKNKDKRRKATYVPLQFNIQPSELNYGLHRSR